MSGPPIVRRQKTTLKALFFGLAIVVAAEESRHSADGARTMHSELGAIVSDDAGGR
jgi:hypothetical protein